MYAWLSCQNNMSNYTYYSNQSIFNILVTKKILFAYIFFLLPSFLKRCFSKLRSVCPSLCPLIALIFDIACKICSIVFYSLPIYETFHVKSQKSTFFKWTYGFFVTNIEMLRFIHCT